MTPFIFALTVLLDVAAPRNLPPAPDTVQVAQKDSIAPKDSEGFVPVNGDMLQQGESIPASRLVAGAYGFIFAMVALYAASVASRAKRVEEELTALKARLEKRAS